MADRPQPNRDMIKVGVQLGLERLRAKAWFADENIIRVFFGSLNIRHTEDFISCSAIANLFWM